MMVSTTGLSIERDDEMWGKWQPTNQSSGDASNRRRPSLSVGIVNPRTISLAKQHGVAIPHVAVLNLQDITPKSMEDEEVIITQWHPYGDIFGFDSNILWSSVSDNRTILALTGCCKALPCAISTIVAKFVSLSLIHI